MDILSLFCKIVWLKNKQFFDSIKNKCRFNKFDLVLYALTEKINELASNKTLTPGERVWEYNEYRKYVLEVNEHTLTYKQKCFFLNPNTPENNEIFNETLRIENVKRIMAEKNLSIIRPSPISTRSIKDSTNNSRASYNDHYSTDRYSEVSLAPELFYSIKPNAPNKS